MTVWYFLNRKKYSSDKRLKPILVLERQVYDEDTSSFVEVQIDGSKSERF